MSISLETLKTTEISGTEPVPSQPPPWRLNALALGGMAWVVLGMWITPLGSILGLPSLALSGDVGMGIYAGGMLLLFTALGLHLRAAHRSLVELIKRVEKQNRRLRGMASDLETIRSLLKVTAYINSQMEISSLLRVIAREAVRTLDADRSSVMLLDRTRTMLRTVAAHGEAPEHVRNAQVRLGEGIAGWVAQYGKPKLVHGQAEEGEFKGLQKKDSPLSSSACVPLQVGGKVMGVLNVSLTKEGREFQDHDLRLLMLYANHAAVAIRNASLLKASQERARLKAILEGYVSPEVARLLLKDRSKWMDVGEMREITILFADIRGFTAAVQHMGPELVRAFLNEYFTRMSEEVFRHHGTLDKFIGDSVMAFFGAPMKVENPAYLALATALGMMRSFSEMVRRWSEKHYIVGSLSLGAGISSGKVFVGNVGSEKRFDYTVIGQEVNVASRLCAMSQGGQILISQSTEKLLGGKWPVRHMGDVHFKGMERPIHVFEVVTVPARLEG
jgi:adenylate cyclase